MEPTIDKFFGRKVLAEKHEAYDMRFNGLAAKALTNVHFRQFDKWYLLEKSENALIIGILSYDGMNDAIGLAKNYDILQAIEIYKPDP